MAGCGGVGIDDIDSENTILVSIIIDASSSMDSYRQTVIDAYNQQLLKALQKCQEAPDILISTWVFSQTYGGLDNCRLVHDYTPVADCLQLDSNIYSPGGSTPLNEAVHKGLTGILSYGQTIRNGGANTKCIVIVMSDGEENSSDMSLYSNKKVRTIAEALLKQEYYVLAYAFFGLESEGDKYAQQLGFPPQHRITAQRSASDIRKIFQLVSASIISTSKGQVSAKALSANQFFATH